MTSDNLPLKDVGISDCFSDIWVATKRNIELRGAGYNYLRGTWDDLMEYGEIRAELIWAVLLCAVGWTILRYLFEFLIARPFARWSQMSEANQKKFPESLFKFFWYLLAWMYICYVAVFRYSLFSDSSRIWKDWAPKSPVEWHLETVYVVQISFYLHMVYASLLMDARRKDTPVMLFHHFLTMGLIGCAYSVRYVKIGVLLVFLHDLCDALLEFAKMNNYLKTRGGVYYALNDILLTVGFALLTISWFVLRLYLYPIKILHTVSYDVFVSAPQAPLPLQEFFNVLLWIVYCLNVYWFSFLVPLIYRVISGQLSEVYDPREEEERKRLELERLKGESLGNGEDSAASNRGKKVK